MIGRTNACGGGGSGSSFLAYIQVTTDANAQISAVNLHGNAFTGTADSSGSLVLTVTDPGTYTVAETGVTKTATVVVADYGVAYSVQVYAFNGTIIEDGVQLVNFESVSVSGSALPIVTTETYSGKQVVWVSEPSGSTAIWRTADFIDITDYDYLDLEGVKYSSLTTYFSAYGEDGSSGTLAQFNTYLVVQSIYLANLSRNVRWKFGVNLASGNAVGIAKLKLYT